MGKVTNIIYKNLVAGGSDHISRYVDASPEDFHMANIVGGAMMSLGYALIDEYDRRGEGADIYDVIEHERKVFDSIRDRKIKDGSFSDRNEREYGVIMSWINHPEAILAALA